MDNILDFFSSDKGKIVISVAAAVVMYFTPDPIDEIITGLLAAYGLKIIVLDTK